MLLYHDLRAPNPRRVRIFLAEKAVAYDTIEVSIAALEAVLRLERERQQERPVTVDVMA